MFFALYVFVFLARCVTSNPVFDISTATLKGPVPDVKSSNKSNSEFFLDLSNARLKPPSEPSDTSSLRSFTLPYSSFNNRSLKLRHSPQCAEGNTFCEKAEGYPRQFLDQVLSNVSQDFESIFFVDQTSDLRDRSDVPDESPLCPSWKDVIYPQIAKNKNSEWLFVVNQGKFKQGIYIEKCLNQDTTKSCNHTEGFGLGYKTYCKQKFIYRKLIALNEDGETITDTFEIPSCCSCAVVFRPDSKR